MPKSMRMVKLMGILTAFLLLGGCQTSKNGIELTFTEDELQNKLGKKFPKEEKIYGIVPVIIEKPVVKFVERAERIRLSLAARVEVPFKGNYDARLKFSSGINFDPEKKALQLTQIEVEGLEATKLPEKYEPALTLLSTVLAQKYLEGQQIYQLKDRDLKDKTVRYLMKDIRIKDETLLIQLGL